MRLMSVLWVGLRSFGGKMEGVQVSSIAEPAVSLH